MEFFGVSRGVSREYSMIDVATGTLWLIAEPDQTLVQWLEERPADELARILAHRPEAVGPPWPRHLRALAIRLADPAATTAVIRRLHAPAVQVLRAAAVLPAGVRGDELARLLGVDATDPDLVGVMCQLAERALAWENRSGRIVAAPNVLENWHQPLGLGTPAAELLGLASAYQVKEIARKLHLPHSGSKAAMIARIVDRYRDRAALDTLLATGPKGVREVLARFAHRGPVRDAPGIQSYYSPDDPMTPDRWAASQGLLFMRGWHLAEMPREVALTLRGPDWRAPFAPAPPAVKSVSGDLTAIGHEAATAAGHLLDRAGALLDRAVSAPVALLRSGGVGQREVKRLARELHCGAEEIRVLLEVLYAAGLLPESSGGHVSHPDAAGRWSAAAGGARLTGLLEAWWRMDNAALRREANGTWPAVLSVPAEDGLVAAAVRRAVLAVLARLPEGTEAPDLTAAVEWECPLYPADLLAEFAAGALAEARVLGLVVGDAISGLGRALVDGDPAAAAEEMLGVARQEALFGPDLTAVVTGPPTADLARLLDRVADRESRGNASVWRFSPASVRRALDQGYAADELLAALAAVASGALPQSLGYLLRDVSRRHGEVTVTDVVCVVRAADPALLVEIAGHRKLAKLGLRALAPTVLASPLPATATLAALREAGYAPVPAGVDGVPALEWPGPLPGSTTGSAEPTEPAPHRLELRPIIDLDGLASRLLHAPDPGPATEEEIRARLRTACDHLPPSTRWALEHLVRFGHSTRVEATLEDGGTGTWTISHGELDGDILEAWSDEEAGYFRMRLSSITKVN
jgi:hypothetical protein